VAGAASEPGVAPLQGAPQQAVEGVFEVHDELEAVPGLAKVRERIGATAVEYLESLEHDYVRDPELAWELLNAYVRLGRSRAGVGSSIGETRSGLQLAAKTLELGSVVESGEPGVERLDRLFVAYEGLASIFFETQRAKEHLETVERMARLAPRLSLLRQAQAYAELGTYHHHYSSGERALPDFARALKILRPLSLDPSAQPAAGLALVSTLAGFGRAHTRIGNFKEAIAALDEVVQLSERNLAAHPQNARSSRHLYWGHVLLGDVWGGPNRFNLGRIPEAVHHYQAARRIAEGFVAADPNNDMAKLDLARACDREGAAIGDVRPAEALELLEHARTLGLQTSIRNYSGLGVRFSYFTRSVAPLLLLERSDQARVNIAEARKLFEKMKKDGVYGDETELLKAEAMGFYKSGQPREALLAAKRHLALLKEDCDLPGKFEMVDLLERIRMYAAGIDPEAGVMASSERAVTP